MFDLGFAELLIIGIVALIVIGPKDLPMVFRQVGRFVGKARGMAREFSTAMNQAADEAGVKDIQRTIKTATNPVGSAMDGVKDAARDVTSSLSDLDPDSETGKLAAERAENARKIQAATARAQAERKAKEAADALKKAEELEAQAPKES
ncbi:Sec-independent protein translocase protein TatB [uncultured Tateyamaria sp.]|uniref:Sec-independent protein translocase protein TatB n=1 Tax=uncultured Tateyamaria sp. TaxID=455651 RepID=UPI00260E0A11|nr:Sec-independent protein translocase protein TatB [uncultured Tateyamaria sp.]